MQRKGSKEERLKSMGKYMADIASNVVSSVLGEKAGRFTEEEDGSDLRQNEGDISTWRNVDTSQDESLLEEVNDPYAEMVIRGNKKSKPNKQYGVND